SAVARAWPAQVVRTCGPGGPWLEAVPVLPNASPLGQRRCDATLVKGGYSGMSECCAGVSAAARAVNLLDRLRCVERVRAGPVSMLGQIVQTRQQVLPIQTP